MSGDSARVAVVGAGLAGLSAAVALKQAGAHVEIFERMRILGGKATSFTVDGVEVDNGQHIVLACCTEFLDFVDQLGMTGSLHMQSRFAVSMLARGSRPARLVASMLPAPLHLTPSFARYPHLSLGDKVRIGRALLAARRDLAPSGDMASWLTRHHQSLATRRAFWDPFLVPALNAPLEEAGAADGLFVIRTAFLSSRGAARIGFTTVPLARLAEAAAARADAVHLRTGVVSIDLDGSRASALHTDSARRADFDAFVLAVPPQRLATMLGSGEQLGINGLDLFRTQPIVDVHLWYGLPPRTRLLNEAGFAALLDSPVQWVFEKGPGYLCCSLSAAQDKISLPERDLVQLCHRELASVLPLLRDVWPIRGAATRDPDATFVPSPGLRRPGPGTAVDNVAVAGAWTDTGWPATMESAVRSGRAAAAHLLGTRARWAGSRADAPAGAVEELARAV